MSIPRGSLRTFLEAAKSNLHSAIISQQRVTIIVGNESADLDSITSAICLAYLKSTSTPTPLTNRSVNRHLPTTHYPPFYIPLLNIPRRDVKIRPELLKLLPYANLEPHHLITLDDLSAEPPAGIDPDNTSRLQPSLTRLFLTDHNTPTGPLAQASSTATDGKPSIIGCIDHHVDEHVVPMETDSEPRIIEPAGSCTSLVINYCRPLWDELSPSSDQTSKLSVDRHQLKASSVFPQDNENASGSVTDDTDRRREWDTQLAKFAVASILIDTRNLQDTAKTTDHDAQAVSYLESKITSRSTPTLTRPDDQDSGSSSEWDRASFFTELDAAKKDLSALTPEDILRKDYKQFRIGGGGGGGIGSTNELELGISSIVQPLHWLAEKAANSNATSAESKSQTGAHQATLQNAILKFARNRKVDVYAAMTTSTSRENGKFQRELLVFAVNSRYEDKVAEFEHAALEELALESWDEVPGLKESPDSDGDDDCGDQGGNQDINSRPGLVHVWWQRNVACSRKQVAPMLRKVLEG